MNKSRVQKKMYLQHKKEQIMFDTNDLNKAGALL